MRWTRLDGPAMRPTPSQISSEPRARLNWRTISRLLLVILLHVLALLIAIQPGPPGFPSQRSLPKVFRVFSYPEPQIAKSEAPRARQATPNKPKTPLRTPKANPVTAEHAPLKMLVLSSEDFAAADIARLGTHSANGARGNTGAAQGENADGAGEGPGGERLYNADWYKRPTDAEIDYYLRGHSVQPGWGLIACRTAPNYQVEDCRELGESPVGSGLARALRQAAWQFRILPPRVGGRALIGVWVRIRFDFTRRGADDR